MTRSSPLRLAFLIALLCAVGLRLLTPPGWVPNLDCRGGAPLVVCTGDGVHTLSPSSDPGAHHPAGKAAHETCAFAGLAFDAPADAALLAAPSVLPHAAQAPLPDDQAVLAQAWRRPQAPRAPPPFP